MTKSIMQKDFDSCYLCGRQYGLQVHHVMAGVANRRLSSRYQLVIKICAECHTGDGGAQYEKELNRRLKREAQEAFEKLYGHAKWMATFRKNYLDEEVSA